MKHLIALMAILGLVASSPLLADESAAPTGDTVTDTTTESGTKPTREEKRTKKRMAKKAKKADKAAEVTPGEGSPETATP